jgi:hypothetical protein
MQSAPSAKILSFARGRARRVARELVALEHSLDVEELGVGGVLRLRRSIRDALAREIDRRVRLLAELGGAIAFGDRLRGAIERACATYTLRQTARADIGERVVAGVEVAWVRALFDLERAAA